MRGVKDIEKCIRLFKKHKKTVISISDAYRNPFYNMVKKDKKFFELVNFKKKIRSRQLAPKVYDMTTVAWMLKPETILKNNSYCRGLGAQTALRFRV